MRKLFASLIAAACLLAPQIAQASNCYIREYRTIASIGPNVAQVAGEPGTDQTPVAIGASSASSAAFNANTHLVRLFCGAGVSYVFGASPVATTSNAPLAANVPEYFAVVPGQSVAFISNAAP